MNYKCILFDVDGVLAHAAGGWDDLLRLEGMTQEMYFQGWSQSASVEAFETGKLDAEAFFVRRAVELGRGVSPAKLHELLKARRNLLFEGVEAMLRLQADRGQPMACLSNTNPVHWRSIEGRQVFDRYFIHQFLSFEIGLAKPHAAVYEHVLSVLGCRAREVLYLDDSPGNIEAAARLGFVARRVCGLDEALEVLP